MAAIAGELEIIAVGADVTESDNSYQKTQTTWESWPALQSSSKSKRNIWKKK